MATNPQIRAGLAGLLCALAACSEPALEHAVVDYPGTSQARYVGALVPAEGGRMLAEGNTAELASRLRLTSHVDVDATAPFDRLVELLRAVPGVGAVAPRPGHPDGCRIDVAGRDTHAAVAAALAHAGIALYALVPVEPSLEDAFLSLVEDAREQRP